MTGAATSLFAQVTCAILILLGATGMLGPYVGIRLPEPKHETQVRWRVALLLVFAVILCGLFLPRIFKNGAPTTEQARSYGFMALRCQFGNAGKVDEHFILYQHPEGLQPPWFVSAPVNDAAFPQNAEETCVLHNDGPSPAYNVLIQFAYKILQPTKLERVSDSDLVGAPIILDRVPAQSSVAFRFVNDLPGEDLALAPTSVCSMDVPGAPGTREACALPKDPMTSRYVLQFAMILFHHKSRTDCTGFVPPLAKDQGDCPGHNKAK